MITSSHDGYLQGNLLVATPNVTGSHFSKSVILLCAHSAEGAMGIIVNHLLSNVTYAELFEQLNLPLNSKLEHLPVHYGGPVEVNRGFVLYEHNGNFLDEALMQIGDIAISSSLGVLKAISDGHGPARSMLALGYAGWSAGQLEAEMEENSWFSVPMDTDLIFDVPLADRWHQAAKLQGIDLRKFSTLAGHA